MAFEKVFKVHNAKYVDQETSSAPMAFPLVLTVPLAPRGPPRASRAGRRWRRPPPGAPRSRPGAPGCAASPALRRPGTSPVSPSGTGSDCSEHGVSIRIHTVAAVPERCQTPSGPSMGSRARAPSAAASRRTLPPTGSFCIGCRECFFTPCIHRCNLDVLNGVSRRSRAAPRKSCTSRRKR